MARAIAAASVAICVFATPLTAQEVPSPEERLCFLVGKWESVSVDPATGAESKALSHVRRVIGGQWLRWDYTAEVEEGTLEVTTLVGYQEDRKRYAFYSFNPMDSEPIPHFGSWIDDTTLRIETDFGGEKMRVEFVVLDSGAFVQEHSRPSESGGWEVIGRTRYSPVN